MCLQTVALLVCVIKLISQCDAVPTTQATKHANGSALNLILLHNNDLHGHFEETCIDRQGVSKCFGGFGRISTVVKQYRSDHDRGSGPPVLFLNAGDTYTGTPWFSLFKDKIASEMMNALKFDAGVSVHTAAR